MKILSFADYNMKTRMEYVSDRLLFGFSFSSIPIVVHLTL